jgi:hypothetical protein
MDNMSFATKKVSGVPVTVMDLVYSTSDKATDCAALAPWSRDNISSLHISKFATGRMGDLMVEKKPWLYVHERRVRQLARSSLVESRGCKWSCVEKKGSVTERR